MLSLEQKSRVIHIHLLIPCWQAFADLWDVVSIIVRC